jgi:Kef-type K+ transport system membrane component KefB
MFEYLAAHPVPGYLEMTMGLATADLAHVLLALAVILIGAHTVGALFAKFRQPRAIGEIIGGLLLGPTVFGAVAPGVQESLFPSHGQTATVLAAIYQLGLLLLMYCSGIEVRSSIKRREGRTVAAILVLGTLVPFLAGLGAVGFIDETAFFGPAGNKTSFLLVFAIAMAVTSIPVISRIMFDLGILGTPFARIVIGVAVIEDIVLYIVLAIALGTTAHSQGALFGLPGAIGFQPGSAWDLAYHAIATVGVLAGCLLLGRRIYQATARSRFNVIGRWSPVAFQLVFMLAACLACIFLGIQPFFGAFVAGIVVGTASSEPNPVEEGATVAIKEFAFAFFIPIYFATVGLQLDLLHSFSPLFFLGYLLFACLVKTVSVYAGARVGGQPTGASVNLAVAMNARGGPGIVLASVVLGAGIINQSFYAVLVLLAVTTSLLAGSWLERVPRDQLLATGPDRTREVLDPPDAERVSRRRGHPIRPRGTPDGRSASRRR